MNGYINKRPSHFDSLKVIKIAAKRNVPRSSAVLQELGGRATLDALSEGERKPLIA